MRTARPQALSEDGSRLIVTTDDGEQIAILADARLRQLLRGERPRPQLEIEMDTELTPREIQARIRAGASVEELVSASGMPIARIEAFASPVIAEREHIAGMAQLGSVRRRGEQAGHRTLRAAIAERLRERDVDAESVLWDAYKLDDGRWLVSADYRLRDTDRQAVFYFDHRGRFSVSGNEDARWMIGEQPNDPLADPVSETEEGDAEPTVRLSGDADELALLRAVETGSLETELGDIDDSSAGAAGLHAVEDLAPDHTTSDDTTSADTASDDSVGATASVAGDADQDQADQNAEPEAVVEPPVDEDAPAATTEPSQLDLLYDFLGSEGIAEDSVRVYEGLSDAAAVPEVADDAWQAPLTEDVPAEPESEPQTGQSEAAESEAAESETAVESETAADGPEAAVEPETEAEPATAAEPEPPAAKASDAAAESHTSAPVSEPAVAESEPEATPEIEPNQPAEQAPAAREEPVAEAAPVVETAPHGETAPGAEKAPTAKAPAADKTGPDAKAGQDAEAGQDALPGAEAEVPAKPKPKRKRRAAVPSWDEIMFGSPKGK